MDIKNRISFTVQLYTPADSDWSDCVRHLDNKTTGPREYESYNNNINTYNLIIQYNCIIQCSHKFDNNT